MRRMQLHFLLFRTEEMLEQIHLSSFAARKEIVSNGALADKQKTSATRFSAHE
jgi:hypothetical protein